MATVSAIYGLFPGPQSAERGMESLRAAGISQDNLLVMSSEPFEEYSFGQADHHTIMPWLAVMGGIIGGSCGLGLAWYTQTAYPIRTAGMPIFTLWAAFIVTYEPDNARRNHHEYHYPSEDREFAHFEKGDLRPGDFQREDSDRRCPRGRENAQADIESRLRKAGAEKSKSRRLEPPRAKLVL